MRIRTDLSTAHCIVEQEGKTLIVTLSRPETKNALSGPMLLGMYRAWRELDKNDELICAILTGQGDTFCSGKDLKKGINESGPEDEEFLRVMADVPNIHWQALLRENQPMKPVILAIEGYALAGGTEILQGTDIRVAAEDAVLGIIEVQRGLYPVGGSSVRLRRQIPYCLAAEMLLLGETITAAQAKQFGLINHVVPKGQALTKAREIANRIGENAPLSVKALTRILREVPAYIPEQEALDKELEIGWPILMTKDAKEGMRAFKEKRKAIFTGE